MTAARPLEYRFASAAQWNCGLSHRFNFANEGLRVVDGLSPEALRQGPDVPITALTTSAAGTLYWVENAVTLRWQRSDMDDSGGIAAAEFLMRSPRLIAGRRWLWAYSAAEAQLYRARLDDLGPGETIAVRDCSRLKPCEDIEIVDIAGDGCDGLWILLLDSLHPLQLLHVTQRGKFDSLWALPYCEGVATAMTALSGEVVIFHADTQRLLMVSALDGTQTGQVGLAGLGSDFSGVCLGSDGERRIVLGGTNGVRAQRCCEVVMLARTARTVDPVNRAVIAAVGSQPPRAVAINSRGAWAGTDRGLWLFGPAKPSDPHESTAAFLTPLLTSPLSSARNGWLRAELDLELPPGTTLTLSYATTADSMVLAQVQAAAAGAGLPADAGMAAVSTQLANQFSDNTVEFAGQLDAAGSAQRRVGIPLDSADPWLWLSLNVTGPAAGAQATLHELRVLYPNESLMGQLPAIFQAEGQKDDLLRRLVGVMETTTQGLDKKIGRLGSLIDPISAPADWLDYLAGWLDLPWDTRLSLTQKRALLTAATTLLQSRGTRSALLALLKELFPDAAIAIEDFGADYEASRVGGKNCTGAMLPCVLMGVPRTIAVLGERAPLCSTRLTCDISRESPVAPFAQKLRIDIATTPRVRAAMSDTLAQMLNDVLPFGSQPMIRWPRPTASTAESLVLEGIGPALLGSQSELGNSVVGGDTHPALTDCGLSTETTLR
jgi:phage tail-like protein